MNETGGHLLEKGEVSARSGKISQILANRRPFAVKANKTVEQLRVVSAALAEFVEKLRRADSAEDSVSQFCNARCSEAGRGAIVV